MSRKVSTTVYLTPEQDEQLRLLSARTKIPIAVYIRQGIDLVLAGLPPESLNQSPFPLR